MFEIVGMQFVFAIVTFVVLLQSVVYGGDNPCANGPPVNKNPGECCDTPMLLDKEIMMNCYKQYGEQTKRQMKLEGIPRGCCIAECGLNATGLYSNGMIHRDDMTKMFMDVVKDMPQWQMLVQDTLDECFKMAESMMDQIEAAAKLEPSFEGEKICHPISGTIMRCMGMNMFVKCPPGVYRESDECNQLREYSKMCPII
ncbi:general odorant-binding protein 67-like [Wyeomyia smithii]|uniref:general odorant-binding protein 67-like n=1 Tax=Wyeomyia smithii TaxID=174621 RepID=UPI002467E96F|nr:general odorant-binding protein 67-like [Wyeomyia smithii]